MDTPPKIEPRFADSPSLPGARFTPDLDVVQGRYRLRFARTEADLEAVQTLRFEVFNLELGEGLDESYALGRDADRFDAQCQHLMVLEQTTGRTIGTYRLQVGESARAGAGFYSAGEFDLSHMPPEILLDSIELGRACIHLEHREKRVLFLLWQGLASYVLWNRKRFFFGCSSLTSQDVHEGLRTYYHLIERGQAREDFTLPPLPDFACELGGEPLRDGTVKIPPLFGIYLRYGAKICGPPAIDRQFKTIDFLTLLDVQDVDPKTFAAYAGTRPR